MRLLTLSPLLFVAMFTSKALAAEPTETDVVEKVRQHITPLKHPLADRLPILTWQSWTFPTGLEDGRVAEIQHLLMDRGLSTLCNPIATASRAEEYIPVLKYRQDRGFPVCILPQGWIQIDFVSDRRGRYKAPHQRPATSSEESPCASALRDSRKIERGAAQTSDVLALLKDHGINVSVLLVDFESGAYLRNTGDREEVVQEQAAMA